MRVIFASVRIALSAVIEKRNTACIFIETVFIYLSTNPRRHTTAELKVCRESLWPDIGSVKCFRWILYGITLKGLTLVLVDRVQVKRKKKICTEFWFEICVLVGSVSRYPKQFAFSGPVLGPSVWNRGKGKTSSSPACIGIWPFGSSELTGAFAN